MISPEVLPELDKASHNVAIQSNAAFEPVFPTDVAAGQHHSLPVDYNKLWMHDAERLDEDAFDLEVKASELLRTGEAELCCPSGGRIHMSIKPLCMEQFLPQRD